jgi:hypothetical protein
MKGPNLLLCTLIKNFKRFNLARQEMRNECNSHTMCPYSSAKFMFVIIFDPKMLQYEFQDDSPSASRNDTCVQTDRTTVALRGSEHA